MTADMSGAGSELAHLGGWIAPAPTGHEEAFLLLGTPESSGALKLAALADQLGLGSGEPPRVPVDVASVAVCVDKVIHLRIADASFDRPSDDEWERVARERGQAVLVVSTTPMPPGVDVDEFTTKHSFRMKLGLVTVVDGN